VLADAAVALRVRHPWESIDLGVLMLRRWARQVAVAAAPIAAAAVIASIALPRGQCWLVIVALWWIKPLLDRLVVVPAGILLFSPRSTSRDITRPLVKSLGLGLLFDLTWRRLSPWRTYLLPARAFENTRGKARRARSRDLLGDSRGWVVGTAALFECIGWAIALSASIVIGNFLGAERFGFGHPYYIVVLGIVYALVLSVVEPLYALSCFSLYLNRRTIAEGWDIELRFKRLRARSRGMKAVALVLLLGMGAWRQGLWADEPGAAHRSFAERVDSVLTDPVFGTPRMEKRLALKKAAPESKTDEAPGPFDIEPGAFERLASQGLRILVAAAIVALAAVAIVAGRGRISAFRGRPRGGRGEDAPPQFERALGRKGLLESAERAEALWRSGGRRVAVAELYRAAIAHGAGHLDLRIRESSTEGDCAREARRAGSVDPGRAAFASAFARIVESWSALAWGGREPSDEDFALMLDGIERAAEKAAR
jgi:hypothetical protein